MTVVVRSVVLVQTQTGFYCTSTLKYHATDKQYASHIIYTYTGSTSPVLALK